MLFRCVSVLLLYICNTLLNNDQFAAFLVTDCIALSINTVVSSCLLKSGMSWTDTFYDCHCLLCINTSESLVKTCFVLFVLLLL